MKIFDLIKMKLFSILRIYKSNNHDKVGEQIVDETNDNLVVEEVYDKKDLPLNNGYVQHIDWETIEKYDIVLVQMNESDKWYSTSGHEIRPFVVKKKNNERKTVNGYYLTSNLDNKYFEDKKSDIKIILSKNNYKLKKNSLLLFQKSIKIPYEQIIHYIDHLSEYDLQRLKRSLSILHGHYIDSDCSLKICSLGDVVLADNKKYIVYAVDNVHSYGYLIEENNKVEAIMKNDFNRIIYNGKMYYIYFEEQQIFDSNQKVKVVDHFDYAKPLVPGHVL